MIDNDIPVRTPRHLDRHGRLWGSSVPTFTDSERDRPVGSVIRHVRVPDMSYGTTAIEERPPRLEDTSPWGAITGREFATQERARCRGWWG